MKVLHINTNDISGGAAKAANRLHKGLRKRGVDSWMLVQKKESDDSYVISKSDFLWRGFFFIRQQMEKLQLRRYLRRKKEIFNVSNISNIGLIKEIKKINPDIINLHWINGIFLSINQLEEISQLNIPIVWTLHDSWSFTGGCHIPYSCLKYKQKCGYCPILNSNKENDLSRKIWLKKSKIYNNIKFTVVTPSHWLKDCAEDSSLLKNKDIIRVSNSIDLNEFKLINKSKARKELNLSPKKKYILFGAMSATTDINKGFDLLMKSLNFLEESENLELLVFGNTKEFKVKTKIPIHFFGIIKNIKKLNQLYSASDVTILSSRSENFPNILLESFSCGTPCVAFKIGGIPEIINHKNNGYLAKPFDTKDLAKGITWCTKNKERNDKLGKNAREKAIKEYNQEIQDKKYIKLYQSLQYISKPIKDLSLLKSFLIF